MDTFFCAVVTPWEPIEFMRSLVPNIQFQLSKPETYGKIGPWLNYNKTQIKTNRVHVFKDADSSCVVVVRKYKIYLMCPLPVFVSMILTYQIWVTINACTHHDMNFMWVVRLRIVSLKWLLLFLNCSELLILAQLFDITTNRAIYANHMTTVTPLGPSTKQDHCYCGL